MMQFIGGTRDEAATRAYLDVHAQHWRDHGFGFWLLRDIDSNAAIGLAGLRYTELDGVRELEVGYGFLPAYWGRGLASEVTAKLLSFAFNEMAASSVVAIVRPENSASQHVLEKAGLARDREFEKLGVKQVLYRR